MMKNDLMWSYLIHLSCHEWDDAMSPPRGAYLKGLNYQENNNTDVEVWDEVIRNLSTFQFNTVIIDLGDAVQYESHPEICAPDAWSKDFLKQKLDEIRALGMEPIPKLNFSARHDCWLKEYHRMVSSPIYYQVCSDLIKEVCELFDYPKYFHIGFDEETPQNQGYCDLAIVRNTPLWVHDLHFFVDECAKHGARTMSWGGMILYHREAFQKQITRDLLICTGFYDRYVNPGEEKIGYYGPDLYLEYDKLGFDQIPCGSTWRYKWNQLQLLAFGKDQLSREHLKGFMTAPWLWTWPRERYGLLKDAEKFYFARKDIYPETLCD